MKINGKVLALAFLVTMACWAIAWAITSDEIWRNVFIDASQTIRVTAVP